MHAMTTIGQGTDPIGLQPHSIAKQPSIMGFIDFDSRPQIAANGIPGLGGAIAQLIAIGKLHPNAPLIGDGLGPAGIQTDVIAKHRIRLGQATKDMHAKTLITRNEVTIGVGVRLVSGIMADEIIIGSHNAHPIAPVAHRLMTGLIHTNKIGHHFIAANSGPIDPNSLGTIARNQIASPLAAATHLDALTGPNGVLDRSPWIGCGFGLRRTNGDVDPDLAIADGLLAPLIRAHKISQHGILRGALSGEGNAVAAIPRDDIPVGGSASSNGGLGGPTGFSGMDRVGDETGQVDTILAIAKPMGTRSVQPNQIAPYLISRGHIAPK